MRPGMIQHQNHDINFHPHLKNTTTPTTNESAHKNQKQTSLFLNNFISTTKPNFHSFYYPNIPDDVLFLSVDPDLHLVTLEEFRSGESLS